MNKRIRVLLNRHFALILALMAGALVAVVMIVMPEWRFASLINLFGIDRLIPAAQPPFGGTARKLAALLAGLVAVGGFWPLMRFAERLMGGTARTKATPKPRAKVIIPAAPRVSAADAHPDAPPRRPIFAETELGAPLMSEAALAGDGELMLGTRDEALDVTPVAVDPLPDALGWPMTASATDTVTDGPAQTVDQNNDSAFQTVVAEPDQPLRSVTPNPDGEDRTIDGLINRLDTALRGKSIRHLANPDGASETPGDIASLRQALRGFGGTA